MLIVMSFLIVFFSWEFWKTSTSMARVAYYSCVCVCFFFCKNWEIWEISPPKLKNYKFTSNSIFSLYFNVFFGFVAAYVPPTLGIDGSVGLLGALWWSPITKARKRRTKRKKIASVYIKNNLFSVCFEFSRCLERYCELKENKTRAKIVLYKI